MDHEHGDRSLKEEQPSSEASGVKPRENKALEFSNMPAERRDEENPATQSLSSDHGQSQDLLVSEEEASSSTPSFTGLSVRLPVPHSRTKTHNVQVDSHSERDDDSAIGDTSV